MVTPELIAYISTQLAANVPPQDITTELIVRGWQMVDIQEAFKRSGFTQKQVGHMATISGTIPSLLQATVQVVTRKWLPLLGLSVFTLIIIGISTFLPGPILALFFAYMVKTHPQWYVYVFGGLGYIVFFVIMGTIQSWGPLAMIHVILHRDEKISTWRSLGQTRRLVSRFWSLGLLSGLSVIGSLFLFLLPFVLLSFHTVTAKSTITTLPQRLTGPGSIVFIIGLILGICAECIVGIWITFGAQALVDGSLKPLDAMTKSKQLVTGNVWYILLRLSVILGVSILISVVIMITQTFVKGIHIPELVIESVILLVFVLFCLIYMTLIYEHVRDQRMRPQPHPVRVKFGFAFLSIMGVVMPLIVIGTILMAFGPMFSGLLTGILTKQLKSNPSIPSPLPGYVNPYTGSPGSSSGLPSGLPNIPAL